MQASPELAQSLCNLSVSRIIFAVEGLTVYMCTKQQGEVDQHPPYTPLEEVTAALDWHHRRRIKDPRLGQTYHVALWSRRTAGESSPCGNLARELSKAIPSEKGKGKGKGSKGFRVPVPIGQNGNTE